MSTDGHIPTAKPDPITKRPTDPVDVTKHTPSVTPITRTLPTEATTKATAPPTPACQPLPQSSVSPMILEASLQSYLDNQARAGYIPTSMNAFEWNGETYFSLVFVNKGKKNAARFVSYAQLTIENAKYIIRRMKDYKIVSFATYNKNGQGNAALVFEVSSENKELALDIPSADWQAKVKEMRQRQLHPTSIRVRRDGDKAFISTLFTRKTLTFFRWQLSWSQMQQEVHRQQTNGYYVTDLSYEILANGEVNYIAFFDGNCRGRNIYYKLITYTPQEFSRLDNYARYGNYKVVAYTPLPQKEWSHPGYFGIYWH